MSTVQTQPSTESGTVPEDVPLRGSALSDVWVIARRGLLHMRRQPEVLADVTIQPVMFVLLFAYVFGGAIAVPDGGDYKEFLMGGIFAQTIVFTCFGVAMGLAADRGNGAIDRFRSLPIARGAVLGGHALANVVKTVLPITLMSLCGLLVGWQPNGSVLDTLAGFGLMFAFSFAMIWVGVLHGQHPVLARGGAGRHVHRPVPADVHRQHVRPDARPCPASCAPSRSGTRRHPWPTVCATCSGTREG